MPTIDYTDAAGRWAARTPTGPADFTDVHTEWDETSSAYVTSVAEYVAARWIPLECHRDADEESARTTHRDAVRRHRKRGTAKTLPPPLPRRAVQSLRRAGTGRRDCPHGQGDPHPQRVIADAASLTQARLYDVRRGVATPNDHQN